MSGGKSAKTANDNAPTAPERDPGEILTLDLEGFEGPIDVLLTLARDQKVDLAKIKILDLADQYLAFIEQARDLRLELAADYLVMAAWLAYLKSRLLLPEPPKDDEPDGPELAAHLAFQLRRLEAMQRAGAQLMVRPRLGVDVFARGNPEGVGIEYRPVWDVSLYDLLKAYAENRRKAEVVSVLRIAPTNLHSVEDAIRRLSIFLGRLPHWSVLEKFLPITHADPMIQRSALAATFAATLELAKSGKLEVQQNETFGPIYIRSGPAT